MKDVTSERIECEEFIAKYIIDHNNHHLKNIFTNLVHYHPTIDIKRLFAYVADRCVRYGEKIPIQLWLVAAYDPDMYKIAIRHLCIFKDVLTLYYGDLLRDWLNDIIHFNDKLDMEWLFENWGNVDSDEDETDETTCEREPSKAWKAIMNFN